MRRMAVAVVLTLASVSWLAVPGLAQGVQAASAVTATSVRADFDNDGFADLAVAASAEDIGGIVDAGTVSVLYGTAGGLTGSDSQPFTQASPEVAGIAEAGDSFGYALAAGDFNGDSFVDLATGVPGEDTAINGVGAVNVLYGGVDGLSGAGSQLFTQASPGMVGTAEDGDQFGQALAVGDFDNDGVADLAVGVPEEDLGTTSSAGAVNVLYGGVDGLSGAGSQLFTQDSPGVVGTAEVGDVFEQTVAAGDFSGDAVDDLAVGIPNEDLISAQVTDAGAVNVLYAAAAGRLGGAGSQLFTQDSPGVAGTATIDEFLGSSLAAGDFDDDGVADLAIGVPFEGEPFVSQLGAVNVLYGSASGLTGAGSQLFDQGSPGVVGTAENGDRFGSALAAGDVNGDGIPDLAVGVPFEDGFGAVNLLYGTAAGLSGSGSQLFTQNSPGVPGAGEAGDRFGQALAVGDFEGDGFDDLTVGVPAEDVGTIFDAGAVNVLKGAAGGLTGTGSQQFTQDSPELADTAEDSDQFGAALAVQ
jgi:FG-GAP repeat